MPGDPAIAPVGINTTLPAEKRRKEGKPWRDGRETETSGSLHVTGQFVVPSHLFQISFAKGALPLNPREYLISQTLG